MFFISHCSERAPNLNSQGLEVLLAPDESISTLLLTTWTCVHVALDVQLTSQALRSTEEDTTFPRTVYLANGSEDHVPIGTAEVGGCA